MKFTLAFWRLSVLRNIKLAVLTVAVSLSALSVDAMANSFVFTPMGTSSWQVSIDGAPAVANPDLPLVAGQSYTFDVTASSTHPFWIDMMPGLGSMSRAYTGAGLSANGITTHTTITFDVPADLTGQLFYACAHHTMMTGTITIMPGTPPPPDFSFVPDVSGGFGNYTWQVSIAGAPPTANPPLTVMVGQTYTLDAQASLTHPFWIKTMPSTGSMNAYSSGLSANGVTAPTTITFDVPLDAPSILYYDCGNHIEMQGMITVLGGVPADRIFLGDFEP